MSKSITYRLMQDGDLVEKHYWEIFLKDKFPSYEKYWQSRIVQLTNRPININLKSNSEQQKLGYDDEDIYLMQVQ